jgi:hypothetical protein
MSKRLLLFVTTLLFLSLLQPAAREAQAAAVLYPNCGIGGNVLYYGYTLFPTAGSITITLGDSTGAVATQTRALAYNSHYNAFIIRPPSGWRITRLATTSLAVTGEGWSCYGGVTSTGQDSEVDIIPTE